MTLAKERLDLAGGRVQAGFIPGLHLDTLDIILMEETIHRRADRNPDAVVPVAIQRPHHPDDAEPLSLDPDALSQRVARSEQLLSGDRPQHADPRASAA